MPYPAMDRLLSGDMSAAGPVVERAIAAPSVEDGPAPSDALVEELVAAGDRSSLEQLRADLLSRIRQRSDDYQATTTLTLVNRALAAVGWEDPVNWKYRRKP